VELRRATAVGAFLISAEVQAALETMWKEHSKAEETDNPRRNVRLSFVAG
jgi:hypothetical protein